MKVTGHKKLARQLGSLPAATRANVAKAIAKSTEEGARVARTLAPSTTNETRDAITTEYSNHGLTGVVVVVASDTSREEKDKRYSIEHGRKKGDRGTTEGYHFVHRTRQYLGKKNRARIKRAIRKAVREVSSQ